MKLLGVILCMLMIPLAVGERDAGNWLAHFGEQVCEQAGDPDRIRITEEDAYQLACEYWDYYEGKIAPETGFEMFVVPDFGGVLQEDAESGAYYYSYLLRWLVVGESGDQWMSTCDVVHIDAQTGECSYPG